MFKSMKSWFTKNAEGETIYQVSASLGIMAHYYEKLVASKVPEMVADKIATDIKLELLKDNKSMNLLIDEVRKEFAKKMVVIAEYPIERKPKKPLHKRGHNK
jgi:hypothetical protein